MLRFDNVNQLFEEADKARAYLEITKEHGPSEQLLAFINYDGELESEIGIEGFNAFSLQARHEILLSKIDVNELDNLAIESLDRTVDKFSKYLMGIGAVSAGSSYLIESFFKKNSKANDNVLKLFGVSVAAILAGGIIKKVNSNVNKHVLPYEKLKKGLKNTKELMSWFEYVVNNFPNNFSSSTWNEFNNHVGNKANSLPVPGGMNWRWQQKYRYFLIHGVLSVPFEDSGWDSTKLKDMLRINLNYIEEYEKHIDQFEQKILKLKHWLLENKKDKSKEVMKIRNCIKDTIKYGAPIVRMIKHNLEFTQKALSEVTHHFEEKK